MADDSLVPVCSATETPTEARATGGMSVNLNAADAGPAMMLTVSHVPVGQVDETGDGVEKLCNSSAPSGKKEPDSIGEKSDTATIEGAATTRQLDDESFYEQTTVEVCVKMVVCRKFITKKVNAKTGKVIYTAFRTEEDPPKILDVHTYDTKTDTDVSKSAVSSIPAPAPTLKRRRGRPRKLPPTPTPPAGEQQADSEEEESSMPSEETGTEVAPCKSDASIDGTSVGAASTNSSDKSPVKSERRSIISTRRQAANKSPSRGETRKLVPIKRGRGRPPRVIKKPRKYLDSYDEELVKPDPGPEEDSQEDGKEDDSSEEEENEDDAAEDEDLQEAVNDALQTLGQKTECPKCGKKFTTSSNCHRHILKDRCSHGHQCGFCDKQFGTRSLLERHIDSHRDQEFPNSFRCSDCNRTYATRNGYLKHKRQGTCYKRDVFHEDGTQGEFECQLCRTHFTTDRLLSLHKEKVHENPNNEYKCPDCGRIFYSKLGFNKHTAKKSCTLPFICKVCGKKYSNKAKESYKSHMRYHMAEVSGVQFQCEDCGRVYMTDMALKKHKLSHSAIRPYKCSQCPKTFPMRYMVKDHERMHTGEKPFLCNMCGTSFGNRGHLYRHIRSHQLGTLHKRGRPRKFPQSMMVKISKEEEEEVVGDLVGRVGGELGVVEIKADPMQEVSEEMAGSMMGPGPTYITVHTVEGGQLGEPTVVSEGQLQHVVMEAPDGMTDNVVLQVIRDLTGATTVYQQVTEAPGVTAAQSVVASSQQPQIIVSAAHSGNQQPQIIVASPQKVTAVSQPQ